MDKSQIQRIASIIKQNRATEKKQVKTAENKKEKAKKIATILNDFKKCLELID